MSESTGPPRIQALSGFDLNRKLFPLFQGISEGWRDLRKATIISYRYQDFETNNNDVRRPDRLVKLLVRAAENGCNITFMTRDPFSESGSPSFDCKAWNRGLEILDSLPNVEVLIHKKLHAKIYLIESDSQYLYAVGSSNLTNAGMGGRWSECNAVGRSKTDFDVVQNAASRIINEKRDVDSYTRWRYEARKSPRGLPYF